MRSNTTFNSMTIIHLSKTSAPVVKECGASSMYICPSPNPTINGINDCPHSYCTLLGQWFEISQWKERVSDDYFIALNNLHHFSQHCMLYLHHILGVRANPFRQTCFWYDSDKYRFCDTRIKGDILYREIMSIFFRRLLCQHVICCFLLKRQVIK